MGSQKQNAEAKAKKAEKQNDKVEAKDTDADDEEDEDTGKSIDYLQTLRDAEQQALSIINKSDPQARKEALLAKAKSSQLSKEEAIELNAYVLGKSLEDPLNKAVAETFTGSESLQKSVDASDFLSDITASISKSLTTMADSVQENQEKQQELSLYTAKSIVALSQYMQHLGGQVEEVLKSKQTADRAPARAPMSAGVTAKPVKKNFAGSESGDEGYTYEQKKHALEAMFAKSKNADLGRQVIHFNVNKTMTPQLEEQVTRYLEGLNN